MKTKTKRIFCFLAAIFVVSMLLASTCFAWTRLPFEASNNEYCFAFKTNTSDLNFCIYAYSHDNSYWYVSVDGLTFSYLTPDLLDTFVYIPIKYTSPTEAEARQIIQNEISKFNNSLQGEYFDGLISGAYEDGYIEGATTQNYYTGYEDGYNEGFDVGKAEGLDTGYQTGYTDGGKDSGYMKNYLITIFSSPYYLLNEVFNFDIFGVSVAGVLMFIISIILVGFVIKLIV